MSRTIFITGANSGVGLATTSIFLERGWNVVATARNTALSEELQALSSLHSTKLLLKDLDLLKPETFQPAIESAIAKFTKVDVLLNNAGYGQVGMMEALSVDDYRRQFDVNVIGPIDLTKRFLPHFHETGSPASPPQVIFVSSGAAHFAVPFLSAYNSSKSALDLFAEAVSYELAALSPCPVRVKLVIPHGGIQSTNFSASSNSAPVSDIVGKRPELSQRYGTYLNKCMQQYGVLASASMPVTEPAERIWEAATDGKTKLRYFVPRDGIHMQRRLAGMKDGEGLEGADERYMSAMRASWP